VVLFRGHLPCDILFIGEAPGESEDALGIPFIGESGKLLGNLLNDAILTAAIHSVPRYGITNIVCCIPRQSQADSTGEIRPPIRAEAEACRPRLLELLEMANPQQIILLGDIAKRFFPKLHNTPTRLKMNRWNGKLITLVHPAAILRQESIPQAQLMSKRFILNLAEALKELTDAR